MLLSEPKTLLTTGCRDRIHCVFYTVAVEQISLCMRVAIFEDASNGL